MEGRQSKTNLNIALGKGDRQTYVGCCTCDVREEPDSFFTDFLFGMVEKSGEVS